MYLRHFKVQQNHTDVVRWLIDNVGPELEHEPSVFCRGEKWMVIYDSLGIGVDYWVLEVSIDDEQLAMLFLLSFS